jgi:hypothetical protein
MTVTNANYSSIEEVWGEQFPSASKPKKEKRKKIVDPLCELYEMGNNNGYTENDLITYANSYFERQDKGKNKEFQRSMNDLVSVFETPSSNTPQSSMYHYRENPSRHVNINAHNTYYDTTEDDEDLQQIQQYNDSSKKVSSIAPAPRNIQEASYAPAPHHNQLNRKRGTYAHINDDDDVEEVEDSSSSRFAFIDLLLYIVSGIILIFVMEQFVKIGILLQ